MSGFGDNDDEFVLTEMAQYVNRVAIYLEAQGVPPAQVRKIIDGYSAYIPDEFFDGTSSQKLAAEFYRMFVDHVPMQKSGLHLFGISRYVALVVTDLISFGVAEDDALDIVDEFDKALFNWYRTVSPRDAARRLGVMHQRLAVGVGLQED